MKTKNNILFKCFMLLILAVGWGGSAWAAYVNVEPSPQPSGSRFVAGTKWYTIQFNGNDTNHGTGTTSIGSYMNADIVNGSGLMLWGSTEGNTDAAKWCFVPQSDGKYLIYNKKKGPSYVLGIENPTGGGNQNIIFYSAATAPAASTHFESVNNTAKAGNTLRVSNTVGINNSGGVVKSYQHGSNAAAGANFSMTLTLVETVPDGYRIVIGGDSDAGYTVTTTADVNSGEKTAKNGAYINLTNTVTANDLRSLSIDAPATKFVWGPVVDNDVKTITYTIKDMVTSAANLTTGFYQLQLFDDNNQKVTNVNNRINGSAGNINTKASTIYVMPYKDVPTGGDQNLAKYSGVPSYAGEASTFFYIEKDGNNIQVQSVNGHYATNDGNKTRPVASRTKSAVSSGYDFPNGHLRFTGWVIQGLWGTSGCTGNEGPRVAYNGGTNYEQYNAAKVDLSPYSVYKVQMDNVTNASDIANDPSVSIKANTTAAANNCGLSKVYQNGYFFFTSGYEPTLADFTVSGVSYSEMTMEIEGAGDIKTLHFKENSAITDPYVLQTSPAPTADGWAEGTKWFSIQNNRSNQTNHNYKYLSTAESSVNDNCTLKASIAALEGNRGEAWAFVQTSNGMQIYNAAYGPEFVLGSSANGDNANATFKMVRKDDTEGYYTFFSAVPNSVLKAPSTHSYGFRVGTSGNVHVHVTNGALRTWNNAAGLVGSNNDGGSSFTLTAIEDIDALPEYDVYKVETNAGTVSYNGTREVFGKRRTSPYFVLAKGDPEVTQADIETSRDIESFSLTTPSETYIKTISLTLSFPHILHRQHAVFNHLHSAAEKPSSKYIQDGDGMIPHPYAANFTDAAGYNENDRTMQNTSVFHITQYTKKGGTTQVRMPYRRERDGSTKNSKYQRWYDYTTERLLEPGIVNLAGFATYANGQAKTSGPLGMTNITLPTTKDEIIVGVDASEFEDYSYDSDGNLIEPSLSMHVVIHVKDAAQMANALTTSGDTWWEEKTYIVPNIKRGDTSHKNNVDLLPLDMPFTNYWIYDNSHNLMRIVEEGGNYNSLANNLVVEVEGSAASYITADIFKNNSDTGIGDPPPVATNHFIYYKVKGSDLTRTIPAGSQAVIKVYARNGVSGTRYQLAKFTLNFEAETEPLAITSVIGNAKSTRSVDYFLKNGMKEVANLTFKEKAANFTAIKGLGVQEGTYAYPLDPTRTSYSYSPNDAFAGYRVTKKAYGMKVLAVSLYERNIKSEEATPTLDADPDDYYFYVDASEAPGQVASIPLDGNLCRGTKLYFYGWLNSQNPIEYNATSASVILELIGKKGGNETVLARYAPGIISDVAYTPDGELVRSVKDGKTASNLGAFSYSYNINGHGDDQTRLAAWQSIGFNYTLSEAGFDGFELRILNNCFSTVGGDYSLDDFRVFVKTPQVNVDNAAPICGDELSIVRISTDFDAMMDALQGKGGGGGTVTYYGTYAILDKEVYDKRLEDIASPTKADVADAFNLALMGETEKSNCIIDGQFFPELYAFHDIKFYSDYLSHQHVTYSMLVGDNILDTAGYMYQYNQNGDVISRNLVFNCKITDERIAGKKYYLVFSADVDPYDMTSVAKADYAEFFSLGDICCVISEFQTMRAQMVNIEGADELDPFNIDYCPGTAPTISLNSYGYDINGELIQEHGVYYDWYFGTKEDFHKEYVWINEGDIDVENLDQYTDKEIITAEDFCMEHCLMNFRYFYPTAGVKELYDGTVHVHHFEKDDETDTEYELTPKMIDKLKKWVEAGKLRLHLTAVSVDLSAYDAAGDTHILAIPQGAKLRYDHADVGKDNPIIYCMDPVEISFHTNLESPRAGIGIAGIDYSATPYDRDSSTGVLYSIPVRVNMAQIRNIFLEDGVELRIPLRSITPSGYYKEDDSHGNPVSTNGIHLTVDPDADDIVVVETNDPYWQMRKVDEGGGEYHPVVGKLRHIDANKTRSEGVDYLWMDFNDESIHDLFDPREGYYYILRANFVENVNPEVTLSTSYEVPNVKCHGNILIPIKIVPEYMKWTGRESDDWNNDRNWIRADYRELVPSDQQNHEGAYATYRANQEGSIGGGQAQGQINGLPLSANDGLEEAKMDMYIPMDQPTTSSLYNTFAYAPMEDTHVIIPSGCERYPALTPHGRGTAAGEKNLLLIGQLGETNTPWINYDMVARKSTEMLRGESRKVYVAETYYENEIKDITFLPSSMMYDAQYLQYNKAWVEYALNTNRWYTIASPLQEIFSGEWYSPTASGSEAGRQLTPHFHDITYNTSLNNRFNPAYYQRSWDQGTANMFRCFDESHDSEGYYLPNEKPLNVAIGLDWSHVYNDVEVNYSNGGFSVKPAFDDDSEGQVLVRMPKADTSYLYFDEGDETDNATHRGDETSITRGAGHYRLISDKLATDDSFTQSITNANGADNPYYLVANPFMAPMDMDEFFKANEQFEAGKFWIMTNSLQEVNMKTTDGWISTTGDDAEGAVAPLQAFFVKLATPTADAVTVTYNKAMQKALDANATVPVLKAPARKSSSRACPEPVEGSSLLFHIEATGADGALQSQAAVVFSETADNAYRAGEDAELLLDGNTAEEIATVFTAAPTTETDEAQAMQFNALSRTVTTIPVGVIAPTDETETTLTFTGITALTGVMAEAPYLYDAANGSFTVLDEETTLTVEGTSAGRYFIVSGMHMPYDNDGDSENGEEALKTYNLHGIRVATPQHGTVTIRGSRKEFNR